MREISYRFYKRIKNNVVKGWFSLKMEGKRNERLVEKERNKIEGDWLEVGFIEFSLVFLFF